MKDEIKLADELVEDKRVREEDKDRDDRVDIFERIKTSCIYQRFKSTKKLQIVVVAFIICVALIIYSSIAINAESDSATSSQTSATATEQRLAQILSSIEGAGQVEAMITEQDGEIVGVLVIAKGANDISVRLRLLEATASALGVDRQIVNVYQSS